MLCRLQEHEHPGGGEGLWGANQEVPSFLYGMPLQPGRVFLEETCLVTKPALPFAVLKRRLERRLKAMGIKVWVSHPVLYPSCTSSHGYASSGASCGLKFACIAPQLCS